MILTAEAAHKGCPGSGDYNVAKMAFQENHASQACLSYLCLKCDGECLPCLNADGPCEVEVFSIPCCFEALAAI